MKKIIDTKVKTVEYFGLTFSVPKGTTVLTTDEDGEVIGWLNDIGLYADEDTCLWDANTKDNISITARLGFVDLEGMDWTQTKVYFD